MIYLIGSLKNPKVQEIAKALRDKGFSVFDDWNGSGEFGDRNWREYEQRRGRSYLEALESPFACHAFDFDKSFLDKADIGVLIMPCGKSAHLELGYMIGQGKKGYIVLEQEPIDDWDLMRKFATVVVGLDGLMAKLLPIPNPAETPNFPYAPPQNVSQVYEWWNGEFPPVKEKPAIPPSPPMRDLVRKQAEEKGLQLQRDYRPVPSPYNPEAAHKYIFGDDRE